MENISQKTNIKLQYNLRQKDMRIALILRKSPGKKQEESIEKQREICLEQIQKDFRNKKRTIKSYDDVGISGDDEQGRIELYKFFKSIDNFDYAYCLDVDRFSRSYLGLYWFHKYFEDSECELRFVNGPKLYTENGEFNEEGYLHFFILCGFASYELLSIRKRTSIGRERAKKQGIKLGQENIMEKNPMLCRAIINDREKGLSYSQLADKYELSRSLIWKIINVYKVQTS